MVPFKPSENDFFLIYYVYNICTTLPGYFVTFFLFYLLYIIFLFWFSHYTPNTLLIFSLFSVFLFFFHIHILLWTFTKEKAFWSRLRGKLKSTKKIFNRIKLGKKKGWKYKQSSKISSIFEWFSRRGISPFFPFTIFQQFSTDFFFLFFIEIENN